MYRFDSDYLEGCLPEILEALSKTNLDQTPGYGTDTHCENARRLIQAACGGDYDVHFLVGGTQTNATVISSILRPYQAVMCADSGHIAVHETGAIEHTGHKVLPLPSADGKVEVDTVRRTLEEHFNDPSRNHAPQPAMLYISFPTEKGTLYTKAELEGLSALCREWDIPLFVDGARLGYGLACPQCDITLPELAALVDVFYIGGTKQGALFGEAVVFCDKSLATDFRYSIKQNGGLLAKGRLLGIQFETLFTDNLYLSAAGNAIRQADKIREALNAKGIHFFTHSPTNQIFPILSNKDIARLEADFGFEIWQKIDDERTAVRIVTSWATTNQGVAEFCKAIDEL